MKSVCKAMLDLGPQSPPSQGAWIEIRRCCSTCRTTRSPPSQGAWIEIPVEFLRQTNKIRRPPRRGRGLKSLTIDLLTGDSRVAPLAGGVD